MMTAFAYRKWSNGDTKMEYSLAAVILRIGLVKILPSFISCDRHPLCQSSIINGTLEKAYLTQGAACAVAHLVSYVERMVVPDFSAIVNILVYAITVT